MEASDVLSVLDCLTAEIIPVWLDGGWGIDALVGRQTRPHDDLDLVVRLDQVEQIERALAPFGFHLDDDELPVRCVLRDADDRRVDCHTVRFDAEGNGLQRQPDGSEFAYPAAGFAGRGTVGGRAVPCLTPDVQVLCHTGYPLDAADCHDLRLLHDHFGLPLPPDMEPQ